ncbi:MAG TPA: RNA polymerase sigma factor [Thermoanaerobaculia bacterium]|nr:RNA polymerase sigma factor [Thermoanaerobaculia bacterium]
MEHDPILELIEQIQKGIRVEESSEKLFRRFRPAVQSFFSRKGFTAEESRDLTQEVFYRVFKGIHTFRRESRFERWLWEIAAHIYFNEVRRRRTEKRDGLEQSLDTPVENDDGDHRPTTGFPSSDPSPEERAIQGERLALFRAALQELPDQMRRCCLLRFERGLKYQEIAIVMKISIETVKAHLHQARKRLAARMDPGGENGP